MRHLGPCGDGLCICHRYSLEFRLGCAGFPRDTYRTEHRAGRRFGGYTWNGQQWEPRPPFPETETNTWDGREWVRKQPDELCLTPAESSSMMSEP